MEEPNASLVLRNYQVTLTELGKSHNIIACLPTGSGKTQIAVQLAKHYAQKHNGVAKNMDRIIFLVPTVPLANQQAKVIQKDLSTKVFTSETSRGAGAKAYFDSDTPEPEVLVMTAQLFLNLLEDHTISFDEISLLILDECHHAVKDNPMNNIMRLYKVKHDQQITNIPRILGLTATVIKKNVSAAAIVKEIEKIEESMCCTAVTYEDYQEVLEHSTKAEVTKMMFAAGSSRIVDKDEFLKPIYELLNFFDILPDKVKEDYFGEGLKPEYYLGSETTKGFLKVLREVVEVFEDFGPLGALHASHHKRNFLEDELNKDLCPSTRRIYLLVRSTLDRFALKAWKRFQAANFNTVELWSSSKVNLLFDILRSYKDKENTEDRICCLIFVNTRSSTYSLRALLQQWIAANKDECGFLNPSIVVGVNNTSQTAVCDRITKFKQTQILQEFREKKVNILITTSILEEGIDVPSCNLVIRMDPLQSYTSMIQSMGRARSEQAKYIVLIPHGTVAWETKKMEMFQNVRRNMTETLCEQMREVMINLKVEDDED